MEHVFVDVLLYFFLQGVQGVMWRILHRVCLRVLKGNKKKIVLVSSENTEEKTWLLAKPNPRWQLGMPNKVKGARLPCRAHSWLFRILNHFAITIENSIKFTSKDLQIDLQHRACP